MLNETPPDKLEAALAPILDIDGALRFLALDIALVNSDGYWTRASDYSIYQDAKGRFHIIPHDMNEGLADEGGRGFGPVAVVRAVPGVRAARGAGGPGGQAGAGAPGGPPPPDGMFGPGRGRGGRGMFGAPATAELDPLVGLDDTTKPLRSKLLAVPALRERYLSYVRDIAQKRLDWKTLGPKVQQYQALIAEDVKADTRKLYSTEAFKAETDGDERSLKSFIEKRRAYLAEIASAFSSTSVQLVHGSPAMQLSRSSSEVLKFAPETAETAAWGATSCA